MLQITYDSFIWISYCSVIFKTIVLKKKKIRHSLLPKLLMEHALNLFSWNIFLYFYKCAFLAFWDKVSCSSGQPRTHYRTKVGFELLTSCLGFCSAGIWSLYHHIQLFSLYDKLWVPYHRSLGGPLPLSPNRILGGAAIQMAERQTSNHAQDLQPQTWRFKNNSRNHIWYLTSFFSNPSCLHSSLSK